MKISVMGCGRWGTFIAWYLDHIGYDVCLYGREGSSNLKRLASERTNGLVALPLGMELTTESEKCMEAEIICISVASQGLRPLMEQIAEKKPEGKTFVLCMKGLEVGSGLRLSQVAEQTVGGRNRIAVWLGPGHVQEFTRGVPNCMVIDSADDAVKSRLVSLFSSELIRFYFGVDLIGNEIGAASKNVVGIAAGMLDGMGVASLKGALMSRGTREIARLIRAMGGNELSAYGLCHLGDYEATVFSPHSHNRSFGEAFVKGQSYDQLAEGYFTVAALDKLAAKLRVELPICRAVYRTLYQGENPKEALSELFLRSVKQEF